MSDEMKSWFEWCFDRDAFKFRRLNSWAPDVDLEPHVDVEPAADGMMEIEADAAN